MANGGRWQIRLFAACFFLTAMTFGGVHLAQADEGCDTSVCVGSLTCQPR